MTDTDAKTKAFEEVVARLRSPSTNQTREEMIKSYDLWTSDPAFEEIYLSQGFEGPSILGNTLHKYLSDKKDPKILDVGAGSGLVAMKLKELGYTNIDYLDPSSGSLEVARSRNLYKKYMCTFFTDHMDELETDSYDALVSLSFIGQNHLTCELFPEMIRCVKPGGVIMHVGNAKYLKIEQYKKLDAYLEQLEKEGKWTLLERTITPNFHPNKDGVTLAYRVA